MQVPSGMLRVVGTAGSGKTQLALRLLKDADAAGLKAAYLCFNRALADHMARLARVHLEWVVSTGVEAVLVTQLSSSALLEFVPT